MRYNSKRVGLPKVSGGETGFTLVELLLALFLFALIAGVVFAAFAAVASGVERGRQSMDIYRVGRVALLRMAQEVSAAMAPPIGSTAIPPPAGSDLPMQGKKASGGSELGHDRIDFMTIPYHRYSDKGASYELCHVAYYIAENPQGKTALFREENCSGEDDDRRQRGVALELTDLAVGLEITYYDADKDYEEWPPVRTTQNPLPCRVRLALMLRDAQQYARAFITTVSLPMRGACDNQQTRRP